MNQKRRIAVLFAVLFLLSVAVFAAFSKYIKDIPVEGTVTFHADLADSIELVESKAQKDPYNGSYFLTAAETNSNEYVLLPGLDVPKDPKIRIEGKSDIPAYLYVEVFSTLPTTVTYSLTSRWIDLGLVGPNGGKIYGYDTELDGSVENFTVSILQNDMLYVSDQLKRSTQGTLTFYAYMAQKVGATDQADTFTGTFMPVP